MVELREITKENIDEVLVLRVTENQEKYVSSVACSLAQAYVYRETAFPFAVYADESIVGFIMMGFYEARNQYTLWKLLIDRKEQNKGYGREALKQGMEYVKNRFGADEIYTGVSLGNEKAKALYRSAGFRETGLIEDGMEEMKYSWQ